MEQPQEITQPIAAQSPKKKSFFTTPIFILIAISLLIFSLCACSIISPLIFLSVFNKSERITSDSDSEITIETPTPTVTKTTQTEISYSTMTFDKRNVTITRVIKEDAPESNWWNKMPVNTTTKSMTATDMYKQFPDVYDGLVYHTGENSYYILDPSSYQKISLVSFKTYLAETLTSTTKKVDTTTDLKTMTIDEITPYSLSSSKTNTTWRAVKRATYYVHTSQADPNDRKNWTIASSTIVCYLPILGSTDFIKFDEPLHSSGSETNMCDVITELGILNSNEVKLSRNDAVNLVRNRPSVVNYLKNSPGLVTFDHETSVSYVIHVYEVNEGGTTATRNWYTVNKNSGYVVTEFNE